MTFGCSVTPLKSLEDNEFKEISRAGIREAIKKDLEGIILIREDLDRGVTYLLPRLLIALSILYRYELLTDIRFLYEKFPYPRTQIKAALDELVEMGQAFAVKNGGAFYGLPHSSLAELYFELRDDSDFVEDVFCMDEVELLTEFSISGSNMRASDLSGTLRRLKIPVKKLLRTAEQKKLLDAFFERFSKYASLIDIDIAMNTIDESAPEYMPQFWRAVGDRLANTIFQPEHFSASMMLIPDLLRRTPP